MNCDNDLMAIREILGRRPDLALSVIKEASAMLELWAEVAHSRNDTELQMWLEFATIAMSDKGPGSTVHRRTIRQKVAELLRPKYQNGGASPGIQKILDEFKGLQ